MPGFNIVALLARKIIPFGIPFSESIIGHLLVVWVTKETIGPYRREMRRETAPYDPAVQTQRTGAELMPWNR
jgi:hypothetical protein